MKKVIIHKNRSSCLARYIILGYILLLNLHSFSQTFVTWNDGGTQIGASTLTTITGTYPGGTVTITQTGTGNNLTLGEEFNTMNLNGANSSEAFATLGPPSSPAKSLTFTFSSPVFINSFNIQDIDKGGSWFDHFTFSGVTFTSQNSGGGVLVNNTGTTSTPYDTQINYEYAHWFNSTTYISSFTIDFHTVDALTTAILGYSMEVSNTGNNLGIFGDSVFCNADSIALFALNDSIYSWELDSDPGNVISNSPIIYVSPLVTTTYVVYGTSDTAYHTVYVNPPLNIDLGNNTILCQGETLTLDATVPNGTYMWQDNSTDSTFNVTQPGTYWIEVTQNNCSSSDTLIIIDQDCNVILEIPNIFTPNVDNINDLFVPVKSKGIVSMKTLIYNRWGNKIFESDKLLIEWSGKEVSDGTYFWIIYYTDINGAESSLKGHVTVLK